MLWDVDRAFRVERGHYRVRMEQGAPHVFQTVLFGMSGTRVVSHWC